MISKKYQLVWILLIVLVIMVIIKIMYGSSSKTIVVTNNLPTPTIIKKNDEDYELWNKLPYKGQGFVIEKYIDKKTLQITTKGIDGKIAEKMVLDWLKENKVATESYKLIIR